MVDILVLLRIKLFREHENVKTKGKGVTPFERKRKSYRKIRFH